MKEKVNKGVLDVTLGIRPEDINFVNEGIKIKTSIIELLGAQLIVHGLLNKNDIAITAPASIKIKEHDKACISFNKENIHLFLDDDNETSLI